MFPIFWYPTEPSTCTKPPILPDLIVKLVAVPLSFGSKSEVSPIVPSPPVALPVDNLSISFKVKVPVIFNQKNLINQFQKDCEIIWNNSFPFIISKPNFEAHLFISIYTIFFIIIWNL